MKRLLPKGVWPYAPTLVAFLAMAWIIFRADHASLPPFIKWLYNFPGGDKVGHFILFGMLAALLDATLRYRNVTFKGALPYAPALPLAAILVAVAEAIEEASQAFYPSRSLDVTDVLASWAGIVVFVWIARRISGWPGKVKSPR